jgi:hypothetical protein
MVNRPSFLPKKEDSVMSATEKVKGPASYFPSIETKYGQPIQYWISIVETNRAMKHMEIVNLLKSEHGLGHGHANAVVAHVLSKQ